MNKLFFIILSLLCSGLQAQTFELANGLTSKKMYEDPNIYNLGIRIWSRDSLYKKGDYQGSLKLLQTDTSKTQPEIEYCIALNYTKMNIPDSAFVHLNCYVDISPDDRLILVDKDWGLLRRDTNRWKQLTIQIENFYLQDLPPSVNKKLALELFYMGILDQKYRSYLPALRQIDPTDSIERITAQQEGEYLLTHFEEILKEYGFPTISMAGQLGSLNAFMLLQHSTYIDKYYHLIKEAYEKHDITPLYYAMITDRWLMNQGKKQIYGSQFIQSSVSQKRYPGKTVLWPVEDFLNVNQRRKEMGFITTVEENANRGSTWYIPEEYYRGKGKVRWVSRGPK